MKTLVFDNGDSSRAQPNCSTRASAQGQRRQGLVLIAELARDLGPINVDGAGRSTEPRDDDASAGPAR